MGSRGKEASSALVLAEGERAKTLSRELVEVAESAKAYARDARAEPTRAVYAQHWEHFALWCETQALSALPAAPECVCMYLAARADAGRKVATLNVARAAITYMHRRAGYETPCRHALVSETWKGIRRRLGVAQAQKAPLSARELRAMMHELPPGLHGVRDRALLLLGFSGAFRRSELVALARADVQFTREGLDVVVTRSKTDQEGRGALKVVARGLDPSVCPVRALVDWLELAGIADGPIFRRVRKNGLVGQQALTSKVVALIVKRAAKTIGLSDLPYAGHSLRAGFVTEAKKHGADDAAIMAQTGHRSIAMVHRYHRRTKAWEQPASAKLGL